MLSLRSVPFFGFGRCDSTGSAKHSHAVKGSCSRLWLSGLLAAALVLFGSGSLDRVLGLDQDHVAGSCAVACITGDGDGDGDTGVQDDEDAKWRELLLDLLRSLLTVLNGNQDDVQPSASAADATRTTINQIDQRKLLARLTGDQRQLVLDHSDRLVEQYRMIPSSQESAAAPMEKLILQLESVR